MLRRFIIYLFPPRTAREKLPLLPTAYSAPHYRGDPEMAKVRDSHIDLLIQAGLARTRADAIKILQKPEYRGFTIDRIVKAEKKKRRRQPRLVRAWNRLRRLWG